MELLEEATKFRLWQRNLQQNGLKINSITEHFTRRRHNGEVLFSLLSLDAQTPEGDKIPPICFLKGEVVSILVCLINAATHEKYLLLVKQRRIAEGGFTYEHPAGMVDAAATPLAIAVQEVAEETGLQIAADELIPLGNGRRYFPSTGTSDEAMYFFYTEKEVTPAQLAAFHNQSQGAVYEFERITTHVVPFVEGHRLITNTNGLLLNFLYASHIQDTDLLLALSLS